MKCMKCHKFPRKSSIIDLVKRRSKTFSPAAGTLKFTFLYITSKWCTYSLIDPSNRHGRLNGPRSVCTGA